MGCAGSTDAGEAEPANKEVEAAAAGGHAAEASPAIEEKTADTAVDEARHNSRDSQEVCEARHSVQYQAKETPSGRVSSSNRRSSTPFDNTRIGTHTRHGVMPGPRGFTAAKINQDRGVVCWPFNGSHNQVLLCIFDGHGSNGERASEFCTKTIPELLEAESDALLADPVACLTRNVIKCDELLLGGTHADSNPSRNPSPPAEPHTPPPGHPAIRPPRHPATPPPGHPAPSVRPRRAGRDGDELRHDLDRGVPAGRRGLGRVLRRLACRAGQQQGWQGHRRRPLSRPQARPPRRDGKDPRGGRHLCRHPYHHSC